jgi:hypothetical protein
MFIFSNIDTLPDKYCTDNYLPRVSQDKGHDYGTMLLDLCKQTGIRILNGRLWIY